MKEIYKTLFTDGYFCEIVKENNTFRLLGNLRRFNNLQDLEKYYKGKIKSMVKI